MSFLSRILPCVSGGPKHKAAKKEPDGFGDHSIGGEETTRESDLVIIGIARASCTTGDSSCQVRLTSRGKQVRFTSRGKFENVPLD